MKTNSKPNILKRLGLWAGVVSGILMIPLLAKFPWTTFDFVFAGSVLFVLATFYELTTRNMTNHRHRLIVGIVVLLLIVLIQGWAAAGPD